MEAKLKLLESDDGDEYLSRTGSSGIKNFQSRDFRDGILQNPGIPGFFGTGLA